MLVDNGVITEVELDKLIASYGFVEEANGNSKFLSKTIQLVRKLSNCSYAYVSLLDSKNQQILSSSGIDVSPIPREKSLCQFTLENGRPTIFQNIRKHELMQGLLASEGPYNFYAGFPIINSENIPIGALCILDESNKELNEDIFQVLELLAGEIANRLDTNRNLIKMIKNINTNFKPAACSDINCLRGELLHLQNEVVESKKKLEMQSEELHASNQNLTSFAHRVAHDLKAPLRSINLFTSLIQKNLNQLDNDYKDEHFTFINTSVIEMDRTINNLLSIAKLKTENIQQELFSLSTIIDHLELLFNNDLIENKVKLVKPDQDIKIYGYPSLVRQLLQNLISNGIKYRDESKLSFVKISIEQKSDLIKISVSDNGIGIANENLSKIFKPFKRLKKNQDVEGLGIGLDTCKMILEDMESALNVESLIGQGTSFSFEIANHE